jgi:hypothetical protein
MGDRYLDGLKTLGPNPTDVIGDNRPKINTTIKFTVDRLNTPTCQSILSEVNTFTSKNAFLQRWKIFDSGTDQTQVPNDMIKNLNNFKTDLTTNKDQAIEINLETDNNKPISDYLDNIETQQIPVLQLVNSCLNDSLTYNSELLENQKDITSESKLRLESVKDPETKVSYYEGWFPLFRPISEPALFGIFAASVFLLLLSIGVFLRMSGFQFNIVFPTLFLASTGSDYTRFIYIGLAVGLAGGIGYYGYTKGWFSKII